MSDSDQRSNQSEPDVTEQHGDFGEQSAPTSQGSDSSAPTSPAPTPPAPTPPGYVQPGYSQPEHSQPEYPQSGYPEGGFAQPEYPQPGYQQPGYPQSGYQQAGYPQAGYPQSGYPQSGYAQPGYPPYGYPQQAPRSGTNVLAIISLIAAFVVPLAGIITGHIALSQIRRTHEEGHGIAKAGLILGYVFTGLGILFFIVYFIFIASVIANTSVTR
jgi:Domain of unknown function (DUF4190)